MSLASGVSDLAARIAGYLKASVLPRLLPAGGAAGEVLTKSATADFAVGWAAPTSSGTGPSSGGLTADQAKAIARRQAIIFG